MASFLHFHLLVPSTTQPHNSHRELTALGRGAGGRSNGYSATISCSFSKYGCEASGVQIRSKVSDQLRSEIRRQPLIWRRRQATQSGGESGISARSTLNCWQFLILQAKPQLIEVELLGTRAKPMTQQTLDQQQQLLVLGCSSGTTSRSTAAMAAASPTPPPPCLHLQ
jgi:hypothetical protein